MKYQWRVLQLLPEAERPSYAGLRVDVLERADGEADDQVPGRGRRLSGGAAAPPRRFGARTARAPPIRNRRGSPMGWSTAI